MAVTIDVGKCEQCGVNNMKSASICRQCAQPLPWATAPKGQQMPAATNVQNNVQNSLNSVAWKSMTVQILGGLIFVVGVVVWCGNVFGFMPTFPGAGYITMAIGGAVWKASDAIPN